MTAFPEWEGATGFKGAGRLKWFNRFRSVLDIYPSSLPLSGYLRFKASSTMSFPRDCAMISFRIAYSLFTCLLVGGV